MPEIHDIKTDLGYVQEIVDRSEQMSSPRGVYFLWAAIAR